MKRSTSLIQLITSIFLSGIMVFAILWRGGHEYFSYHEIVLHCEDTKGETHIHDDRYAIHDCFVCAFHFSPTQTWEPGLTSPTLLTSHTEKLSYQLIAVDKIFPGGNFLRGPPAFS